MARYLALEIDATHLAVLAATVKAGKVRLEQSAVWPIDAPLTSTNAAQLGVRLGAKLKEAGIAAGPVIAGVGRDRLILKELRYPAATRPADEPALVRFQTIKDLADSPEEVVIDYTPLAEVSNGGEKQALSVVLKKALVRDLDTLCNSAGLKLYAVTGRPFAALASVLQAMAGGAVNGCDPKSSTLAILTRGERWGEFTVARRGEVVFSRSLSGSALTNESARLNEVKRNLTVFAGQSGETIQALYVPEPDGPGGWSGRLRQMLDVPVYPFDPLVGLPQAPPESRAALVGPAGLVSLPAVNDELPVNFVKPREPIVEADPNRRRLVLFGGLFFLIATLALGFGMLELMGLDKRLRALNATRAELEEQNTQLALDEKRVQVLQALNERDLNHLDLLRELAVLIPEIDKTRVESLKISSAPVPQQPRPGQKQTGPVPVGTIEMKVRTTNTNTITLLEQRLKAEKRYQVTINNLSGSSGSGSGQLYRIVLQLDPRKPGDWNLLRRLPELKKAAELLPDEMEGLDP